jgi:hypothetical protein
MVLVTTFQGNMADATAILLALGVMFAFRQQWHRRRLTR